jgi:hypothetical protein
MGSRGAFIHKGGTGGSELNSLVKQRQTLFLIADHFFFESYN